MRLQSGKLAVTVEDGQSREASETPAIQSLPASNETRNWPSFLESYSLPVIIVVAAVMRFIRLGKESLWFDESISLAIAQLNISPLWKVVSTSEANMALYYALLHVWMKLGDSEFIVRSLSAIAGVLTAPVLYLLAKKLYDTRVALISVLLLAANAYHVRYSQEARGYSLAVLLATLSCFLFAKAVEDNSKNNWIGYVVISGLTLYTHFFGALVLVSQWASLFLVRPTNVAWKRLWISILGIGCLSILLLAFIATKDAGQLAWVSKPTLKDVYGIFVDFAGGGRFLALAYGIPCLFAIAAAARTRLRSPKSLDCWRQTFTLGWLLIPIALAFAVSLFKPVFVDRFLIISLPPLILMAAAGLSRISQRWILAGLLTVILVLSIRRMPWYTTKLEKEDWRGATSYVLEHSSRNSGIVFYTSYGRLGFDYYAHHTQSAGVPYNVVFPIDLNLNEPQRLDPDDSLLAALPGRYDQAWLVLRFNQLDPGLQQRDRSIEKILSSEYPSEQAHQFKGVQVLEFSH